MTKEIKIKEAYGEHWNKVKSYVCLEDGWCSDKWPFMDSSSNCPVISEIEKDSEYKRADDGERMVDYFTWRPTSLQGIEDNNGWTIVLNKCDLPKQNLDCWFENHEGTFRGYYNKRQDFFYDEKYEVIRKDITHYQPITKPNKPIY